MNEIKTIDQKELNGIIDYLAHAVKADQDWQPDIIVTMAKGGLIPSRLLAKALNISRILSYGISFYNENDQKEVDPVIYQGLSDCKKYLVNKKILLVDDISDTGESFMSCMEHLKELGVYRDSIRSCSLYYKKQSRIKPTYCFSVLNNDVWVYFPWE